jgi:hypothetical protein
MVSVPGGGRKRRTQLTVLVYRRGMSGRKRPAPEDAMTARHALLDGLARDAGIFEVLSAAAIHGGTGPDLLDEVASWQTDDFWQYAMYAAIAYVHAAASRAGVPVRQACQDLDEP